MSNFVRKISVFVSSPGGLSEERDLVESVCKQISHDLGRHLEFVIEVLRWEKHTRPAAGLSAQDTINRQMGLDYEIYLGMLGARFGTATERWGSGTEEEFELAYESWNNHAHPEIMFYFAESGPALSQIDPDDLKKRQIFKRKLEERGVLHHSFSARADFEHALRTHLTDAVYDILKDHGEALPQQSKEEDSLNPLANWTRLLEEDPAVQVEDLLLSGSKQILDSAKLLKTYSDRTERIARSLNKGSKNLNATTARVDKSKANKFLQDILSAISNYSRFLIGFITEFDETLSKGLSSFSRGFVVARAKIPDEVNTFSELAASIDNARLGTEASLGSIKGLSQSLETWPDEIPAIQQQKSILLSLTQDLTALLERSIETMCSISSEIRLETSF
ncbi:DUF4062 domain-containing protein [Leisingera sp. F5]|uniref:DUF4062 domain-containing protein n=1 Tax=Leisingera sp. F5 TaxID=1813816 RepID=UPI000AB9EF15|nr:DUF4062 domain-containing protein [Leisingera sp. F5]